MAGRYHNDAGVGKAGADTLGRLVGKDLRHLLHDVDRLLNVLVITDDDVEAQNRVTLSQELPPDEHGPVAKVEFHHRNRSARTRRNREFMTRRAVELLRKAGAKQIHRVDWPPLILHVQSTMRMGSNPANSVVKPSGEARFVNRLFVADNSALSNGLGGPNPTLTSQAVATRTAENIFVRYFGGHRWVKHESPVVSTDPRVSHGLRKRGL
jgi:choline dehydrogenase-like flavoprotein